MIRAYIGFDDTDNETSPFGTGKLVRRFAATLPKECRVWGIVRQQLLVDPAIPYTSHNSAACVVADLPEPSFCDTFLKLATEHLEREAASGSDPGLALVCEGDPSLAALKAFGETCTARIVTQKEALTAAGGAHLSGHGGTNDGIIGAAAAVGLTAAGWSGRFIEFSIGLRSFPDPTTVSELNQKGIRVVSLDRDAFCPRPEDCVKTKGWLRPSLWGREAVLPVTPVSPGVWESLGGKRNKSKTAS